MRIPKHHRIHPNLYRLGMRGIHLGLTCCIVTLFAPAMSAQDNNGINDISFDDLVFEMKETETFNRKMITEDIDALHRTRVRLRGYIRPTTRERGITKFIFVRDNKECCFGPGAALYDCVLVKLAEGKSTAYTVRPVTISGEFFLSEFVGPDGKVWAIYRLKNAVVE